MPQQWEHRYERKPGRWVFVPTEECKARGEEIRAQIAKRWIPPPFYFHLKPGGHVAALQYHTTHTYFSRLDIEDFFGSISLSRVTRNLTPFFGYVTARSMAKDSTTNHPSEKSKTILPYGFTQSPLLASLALAESALGKQLVGLSKAIAVSVYMDDILLSSNDESKVADAKATLEALAPISKFKFNAEKCQGPAPTVTAFNVRLERSALALTEERLAQFAAVLEDGPTPHERAGILGYVKTVNAAQADALAALGTV